MQPSEWTKRTEVTTQTRSSGSYAVCGGRFYCAYTAPSGHIALAVMEADRTWTTLTRGGPPAGAVAPTAVGTDLHVLIVFGSPDGSNGLAWATVDPTTDPPAWMPPQLIPDLRSTYPVGLVHHRGAIWCAAADVTVGTVLLSKLVNGSWQSEPAIQIPATAAPALSEVAGILHCLTPTRESNGTVVDLVYGDEGGSWEPADEQPGVATTRGLDACVVNDTLYLAYPKAGTSQLAVVRRQDGRWQEPALLEARSQARPAIDQFGNHIFVAGQDNDAGILGAASQVAVSLCDWMADLTDDRSLGALSIPGTHDSCALYGGPYAHTQTMSLTEQFSAGIRWFDIRLRINNHALEAYHGPIEQRIHFVDILQDFAGCLDEHPQEAIFISVKKEGGHDDQDEFGQLVRSALGDHGGKLGWADGHRVPMPSLGDLRGRIALVARSDIGPATGINLDKIWPDDNSRVASIKPPNADFNITVEDDYNLLLPNLNEKWASVQAALAATQDTASWHITFTSASSSIGTLPPILAAEGLGPFKGIGINYRLVDLLQRTSSAQSVGTLVLDFPGCPQMQLCPSIIAHNAK